MCTLFFCVYNVAYCDKVQYAVSFLIQNHNSKRACYNCENDNISPLFLISRYGLTEG